MRSVVIYESHWGNTEQVARAVAEGIGQGTEVADVAGAATPATVEGVDLLVLGGPTHAFSMSRPSTRADAVAKGASPGHEGRGLREWVAEAPEGSVAVATFDTKVAKVRRLPGSAAHAAARQVRRHHLGRLVAEESFLVEDMAGPLLDGELDRARAWGAELAHRVSEPR